MSYKDDLNLFVGASYGVFKGVKVTEKKPVISKNIQSLQHLSKESDITALAWNDETEENILLGLSNQTVKVYDTNYKAFELSTDARVFENGKVVSSGSICGLARYDGALVSAVESGHIRVWHYPAESSINIYAGEPLSKMRHSKLNPNLIATGGKENELKLWDLSTGQKVFHAKNVPNDFLDLRVPVWVSDLAFMTNSNKVAVGSRYGYARLYDPKAGKRPVVKIDLPDKAVSCITATNDENIIMCGMAKGDIVAVDFRMNHSGQNFKGFLGAVRDIVCHPTEPYMASVGLDRFLRIHHTGTKELLMKEYLVSRMNCLLMRSNFTLKAPEGESKKTQKTQDITEELMPSEDESEKDLDDLFDAMEKVEEAPKDRKRKKLKGVENETPAKKKSTGLMVNPFATPPVTPRTPTEKKKKSNGHSEEAKLAEETKEDSDDDIEIIDEFPSGSTKANGVEEEEESEPDEADGESDEFESDDSDELSVKDFDGPDPEDENEKSEEENDSSDEDNISTDNSLENDSDSSLDDDSDDVNEEEIQEAVKSKLEQRRNAPPKMTKVLNGSRQHGMRASPKVNGRNNVPLGSTKNSKVKSKT